MSVLIAEKELPQDLTVEQAVEAAYAAELSEVSSKLQRGLPTLVECDKDLAPYLFANVRNRLKASGLRCVYLDGRPRADDPQPMGCGYMRASMAGAAAANCRSSACRGSRETVPISMNSRWRWPATRSTLVS